MNAAAVWVVDLALSPAELERCASILDEPERARAARFMRAADRAQFVASHAALRFLLAARLAGAPSDVRFAVGAGGKPELVGGTQEHLAFNLSHSGDRALIGLTSGVPIGVDVEAVRPLPDAVRIARAHFAADEAATLAAQPRDALEATFFGLWTRKEATVKALGTGLSLPLDRFSVTLPPAAPRILRGARDSAWTFATLDLGSAYAATVAVRTADATIACRPLAANWADHLG